MNIMATTTTLPLTAACGEPIGLFHSSGEDIPPAAESDPAAKNLVLPGRARCLGPSCEPLNMDQWTAGHWNQSRRARRLAPGF